MILLRCGIAAALVVLSTGCAAADGWSTMEEESVSLSYGTTGAAKLEIFCDKNSEIVVYEPRHVRPSGPVVFTYVQGGRSKSVELKAEVCGGELTCTDRKDGEVSAYKKRISGKAQALDWAQKALSFSVKGPTLDMSMNPDKAVFAKFAASCRKWK